MKKNTVTKAIAFSDKYLRIFEDWTLFITVMAALIGLFVGVALRYLCDYSLPWPDEIVREVIQYSTFIGAAAAIRTKATLKIDVIPSFFPQTDKFLGFFSDFTVLCFSVYIMIFGWKAAMNIAGQSTVILEIPYSLLFLIIPLAGALMFMRTIISFWSKLAISETS